MSNQKWKRDKKLHSCDTITDNGQIKKQLDYDTIYRKEFLECDPLRDWESFDRCVNLWNIFLKKINQEQNKNWTVLDAGCKDCQFSQWLREQGIMSVGLEYSEKYVRYSLNLGRPIQYGNVCCMEFDDNSFDICSSHHLLGLVPDNLVALNEMFRVSKKWIYTLASVPGNKRKHFSYIEDNSIFNQFIEEHKDSCKVIYNDFIQQETGYNGEYLIIVEKI